MSLTIDPLYVVDTHAFIWYLTNDKKLGPQASEVFAAAERGETRLLISAIVIAELYYANKKNEWLADFAKLFREMQAKPYYRFIPFRAENVPDFDQDAAVPEMHDRIITGFARHLGVALLTSDPLIIDTRLVKIVW